MNDLMNESIKCFKNGSPAIKNDMDIFKIFTHTNLWAQMRKNTQIKISDPQHKPLKSPV